MHYPDTSAVFADLRIFLIESRASAPVLNICSISSSGILMPDGKVKNPDGVLPKDIYAVIPE